MSVTRISVTADDIANGKSGSADGCPIALAANRAFGVDGCTFSDWWGSWTLLCYEERYNVTGGASFACQFDRDRSLVEPCEFDLIRLADVDDD